MNKLVIATHNAAKKQELTTILHHYLSTIKLLPLTDLHITEEPEETGETFESNAELKARYYARLANLPTLSDDGGLVIDALNGEPGIKSNRWLGRKATDIELIDYTLQRMKNIPLSKRTAHFVVVLCAYNPLINQIIHIQEKIDGHIALKPYSHIPHGYPYRAVFVVDSLNKYYAELNEREHHQVNHREHALKRLSEKLKAWYN